MKILPSVKVHAAVTDGVTVGHPCCAIHNCALPLINNKHRYCPSHATESEICAIKTCREKAQTGHRTCEDPGHRANESAYLAQNQAMFRLKHRLERLRVSQLTSAMPDTEGGKLEDILQSEDGPLPLLEDGEENPGEDVPVLLAQKSDGSVQAADLQLGSTTERQDIKKTKRMRAIFGRVRSHNEQLVVRPCGIIVARKTFFGSESLTQLIVCVDRPGYSLVES